MNGIALNGHVCHANSLCLDQSFGCHLVLSRLPQAARRLKPLDLRLCGTIQLPRLGTSLESRISQRHAEFRLIASVFRPNATASGRSESSSFNS
jgi:hypothetical protein